MSNPAIDESAIGWALRGAGPIHGSGLAKSEQARGSCSCRAQSHRCSERRRTRLWRVGPQWRKSESLSGVNPSLDCGLTMPQQVKNPSCLDSTTVRHGVRDPAVGVVRVRVAAAACSSASESRPQLARRVVRFLGQLLTLPLGRQAVLGACSSGESGCPAGLHSPLPVHCRSTDSPPALPRAPLPSNP